MLLSRCLASLENEGSAAKTIRQGPGILFDAGQLGVFCALSRRTTPNGAGACGRWIPVARAGRTPTGAARIDKAAQAPRTNCRSISATEVLAPSCSGQA